MPAEPFWVTKSHQHAGNYLIYYAFILNLLDPAIPKSTTFNFENLQRENMMIGLIYKRAFIIFMLTQAYPPPCRR
jgi:hypothetical protein